MPSVLLTPEEIRQRAHQRQEMVEAEREAAAGRQRIRYFRLLNSRTTRFRVDDELVIGRARWDRPIVSMAEIPRALVVDVQCPNRLCRRIYQVTRFAYIKAGQRTFVICKNSECRSPITLFDTVYVYTGITTYPIHALIKHMTKKRWLLNPWIRWLREAIDVAYRQRRDAPPERVSTLIERDDEASIPEIQIRTMIEDDEETADSVPYLPAKLWGLNVEKPKLHFPLS